MRVIYLALLVQCLCVAAVSAESEQFAKGKYLFELANCYSCHTTTDEKSQPLAGGRELKTEFGILYSPNITADKKTGIGNWSDQQFIAAIREGRSPDGSYYYPVFPYTAYRDMSTEDILAIKAYLFSLTPVSRENTPHQLKWYLTRLMLPVWNWINNLINPTGISDSSRGAYLLNVLGHCNECHTPRNFIGILNMQSQFSGNSELSSPNIRSNQKGIGDWSDEELSDLFSDGMLPDGDYVSDHMAEVIDNTTSKWTEDDKNSAINYIRSIK